MNKQPKITICKLLIPEILTFSQSINIIFASEKIEESNERRRNLHKKVKQSSLVAKLAILKLYSSKFGDIISSENDDSNSSSK